MRLAVNPLLQSSCPRSDRLTQLVSTVKDYMVSHNEFRTTNYMCPSTRCIILVTWK